MSKKRLKEIRALAKPIGELIAGGTYALRFQDVALWELLLDYDRIQAQLKSHRCCDGEWAKRCQKLEEQLIHHCAQKGLGNCGVCSVNKCSHREQEAPKSTLLDVNGQRIEPLDDECPENPETCGNYKLMDRFSEWCMKKHCKCNSKFPL